jgi:hypothetical protein
MRAEGTVFNVPLLLYKQNKVLFLLSEVNTFGYLVMGVCTILNQIFWAFYQHTINSGWNFAKLLYVLYSIYLKI